MMTAAQLNALTMDQLQALNRSVVAAIKAKSIQAAATFYPGQSVVFTSRAGLPIKGTVTKVKIKMISVDAGPHGRWNVAASLLKAA